MWHEARKSEKKVHDLMDAARKRAQRRAVFLAKRRGDPQQAIQVVGYRCRMYRDDGLYQATQDQQGLIPWNGKQNILIDRFDGRALLDFIRESDSRHFHVSQKTEEEEELEEFVNFERYRDLIKHRRRGFTDEEGLLHASQEIDAKTAALFVSDRPNSQIPSANKPSYSQVGFSYEGDGKDENYFSDADVNDEDDEVDDEDDDDFNSDDSNDEGMDTIAKGFGVKRYGWLVYMDKRAKEDERRQREVIKGDPSIRKLSRKERRKASKIGREKEREATRVIGTRVLHHDPYRESRRSPTYEAYNWSRRSRSRSRSYSPSYSRRHHDDSHRSKTRNSKIEYITEFGGSSDDPKQLVGSAPPYSPPSQAVTLNRLSSGHILEALHIDPASGISIEKEKITKPIKPPLSTSSVVGKLSKTNTIGDPLKQAEKKETPQERLKRIMSKQLNKQIKKDSAMERAKKREVERQRLEKLAESNRLSRHRHRRSRSRTCSSSPPRYYRKSRSRSSRRNCSRSGSRSWSPSPSRSPRPRSRCCR